MGGKGRGRDKGNEMTAARGSILVEARVRGEEAGYNPSEADDDMRGGGAPRAYLTSLSSALLEGGARTV